MQIDDKICYSSIIAMMLTVFLTIYPLPANSNMVKSKEVDFIFLAAYEKSFDFYKHIEMGQLQQQEFENMWQKKLNASERLPRHLRDHFIYAFRLVRESTSLTELFVTLYVKFLAFINGVNYLNCSNFHMFNREGPASICQQLTTHLLWFSELGTDEIFRKISVMMKPPNLNGPSESIKIKAVEKIENMIDAMKRFRYEYIYCREPTTSYSNMCTSENQIIFDATMGIRDLFESIKFAAPVSYVRYKDVITPPDEVAMKLWDDVGYCFICNAHCVTCMIRDAEINKLNILGLISRRTKKKLEKISQYSFQLFFNLRENIIENHIFFTSLSSNRFKNDFKFRYNVLQDPYLDVNSFPDYKL